MEVNKGDGVNQKRGSEARLNFRDRRGRKANKGGSEGKIQEVGGEPDEHTIEAKDHGGDKKLGQKRPTSQVGHGRRNEKLAVASQELGSHQRLLCCIVDRAERTPDSSIYKAWRLPGEPLMMLGHWNSFLTKEEAPGTSLNLCVQIPVPRSAVTHTVTHTVQGRWCKWSQLKDTSCWASVELPQGAQ